MHMLLVAYNPIIIIRNPGWDNHRVQVARLAHYSPKGTKIVVVKDGSSMRHAHLLGHHQSHNWRGASSYQLLFLQLLNINKTTSFEYL